MRGYAIAQRYAKALFDIGADLGDESLDQMRSALDLLAQAVADSSELESLLGNPVFTHAEKEAALAQVLTQTSAELPEAVSRVINNFCALLAEKNRLSLFPLIVRAFASMLDASREVVRGTVCTAITLDSKKKASIQKSLGKSVKGSLALNYQVDPAILGGVMLQLGNRVLDASLRTQLETLRDTIKKGE